MYLEGLDTVSIYDGMEVYVVYEKCKFDLNDGHRNL